MSRCSKQGGSSSELSSEFKRSHNYLIKILDQSLALSYALAQNMHQNILA